MKTIQYDGTSGDLPAIMAEIEATGHFVWDVRFSNWVNDKGEVTGSRVDIDVDETPPVNKSFFSPIETPALYAGDIFVSSRKVKDDPDEAFEEAKQETQKPKGQPKSLDLISRSTLKALGQSREKIKEMEQTIAALEKRLKKLEK